jgi:hypothetical protein
VYGSKQLQEVDVRGCPQLRRVDISGWGNLIVVALRGCAGLKQPGMHRAR